MIAHGVERLGAQIQRLEHDVGAVDGMVVATVDEGRERLFAGMTGGAVPAVVAHRCRRRERHVQVCAPGDRSSDLGDFDRMGEAGTEVIVLRRDEDLALAGQPAERTAVLDAIEIALEARAEPIGLLGSLAVSGARGARRKWRERLVLRLLTRRPFVQRKFPNGNGCMGDRLVHMTNGTDEV